MAEDTKELLPSMGDPVSRTSDKPAAPEEPKPQPAPTTEQVVVTGRPLEQPAEEPKMASASAVREKQRKKLEEGRAQMNKDLGAVDTSEAKIIPNIGQPRAQTSEEIRQDKEMGADTGEVTKAGPYPGNPHGAQTKAILAAERQMIGDEFQVEDLKGTSVDGAGESDTVVVRLLFDWWDGSGVRHPLNSLVEMAINDARTLIEQRKAERTDPLR